MWGVSGGGGPSDESPRATSASDSSCLWVCVCVRVTQWLNICGCLLLSLFPLFTKTRFWEGVGSMEGVVMTMTTPLGHAGEMLLIVSRVGAPFLLFVFVFVCVVWVVLCRGWE